MSKAALRASHLETLFSNVTVTHRVAIALASCTLALEVKIFDTLKSL